LASYIIRRLVQTVFVILIVTIIVFSLMHLIPGDPVVAMLSGSSQTTQEQIDTLRHELWLDRPLYVQYVHWLGNAIHGDFGKSFFYAEDVTTLLLERLPITLYLSFLAFILAIVVGIAAGIISAVRRGGWLDSGWV
jgi:peptide/nickel transport system permease protein